MKDKTCEIYLVHEDDVHEAKSYIEQLYIKEQIRYFKIFSDENRLKIIYAIISQGTLCVCDLAEVIGASIATTSHHLQNLKKQNILDSKKEGKLSFYYLKDEKVLDLLKTKFIHLEA